MSPVSEELPTVRGVRFVEHPYLTDAMLDEDQVFVMRASYPRPGDPLVTVMHRPGWMTPERIGRVVNRLREQGYPVEVLLAPPPDS